MMKPDGIIFDVDGTLWDSVEVCAKAWNHVISTESDLPANVTPQQLMTLFGKPMDVIFNTMFPSLSEKQKDSLAKGCIAYENELLYKEPGTIYPGVVATIKELKKSFPLFIVSNCQSGYIEACMDCMEIRDQITDIACFGDNPVSKGQNILQLMERNGLQNAVYVGDTQGDADACAEAGIKMVFAAYGFGKVEEPEFVINRFEELLELW